MHSHFQILLRGYLGLWENLGWGTLFSCFIAFLWSNFSKSSEGVHEVSPPLPLCAPMEKRQMIIERMVFLIFRRNLNYVFSLQTSTYFRHSNKNDLIRTKIRTKVATFFSFDLSFRSILIPTDPLFQRCKEMLKDFSFSTKKQKKWER